jgi:hypothetical protein
MKKAVEHNGASPVRSGEIRADAAYPLGAFMQITGLGRHGMRAARRAGLRVHYVQKRGFVLGRDFLAYLEAAAGDADANLDERLASNGNGQGNGQ